MLSSDRISNNAEEELSILAQRPSLESSVSILRLNVLDRRFRRSEIYPNVTVELVREQDRRNWERIDLAFSVAETMAAALGKTFTGRRKSCKLVLRINITVVSNGSDPRNSTIQGSERGEAHGKGMAKLTASYCLYCRDTGEVAVAKQLSRLNERHDCDRTSKAVLMELEEEVRQTIIKEVSFACCTRLPQWNQVSMRLIEAD